MIKHYLLSNLTNLQFKITHLLVCTSVIATLVVLRPIGPILVMLGLLVFCLALAIGDLALAFTARKSVPKNDEEYYLQFEPKPRIAILLALIALGIYFTGWFVGTFSEPGKRPAPTILIADIAFTVVGLAFCFYARKKSATRLQTAFTWIPLCCWLLHSIILLGHGIQIERVNGAAQLLRN